MSLSNRSSLRLNLNPSELDSRKSNQIKNISKQNLIGLRFLNQKPELIDCSLALKHQRQVIRFSILKKKTTYQ